MKRARMQLALLILLTFAANGATAGDTSFGVRLGVGAASFQNADYDADRRAGLQIGAFARYGAIPKFALRLEITYAQKGVKNGGATVALDYIDIPLLAELSFPGAGLSPTFFSGPALGVRSGAELRGASGGTFEYGDLVEKYETNWIFGLGATTGIAGRSVLFDVRYSLGLTEVYDFGDPQDTDSDDKNQVFSANVSVALF